MKLNTYIDNSPDSFWDQMEKVLANQANIKAGSAPSTIASLTSRHDKLKCRNSEEKGRLIKNCIEDEPTACGELQMPGT